MQQAKVCRLKAVQILLGLFKISIVLVDYKLKVGEIFGQGNTKFSEFVFEMKKKKDTKASKKI